MLCIGRFEGEKLYIGTDIVVTVVLVRRGYVRLGIDAPRHVPIHRSEDHRERVTDQGNSPPGGGGMDSTR